MDDSYPLVLVLGMVRSGTSAVTNALRSLGLDLAGLGRDDEIAADENNRLGYHESRALNDAQADLLAQFGGTRHAPPPLPPGWVDAPAVTRLRDRIAPLVPTLFPADRALAWKDRSNAFLMPFWQPLLDRPLVNVLIYREPAAVAASCLTWRQWDTPLVLSSWEAHYRAAFRALDGSPTYVIAYEDLLADPLGQVTRLREFLVAAGVAVPEDAAAGARAVRPDLRTIDADVTARLRAAVQPPQTLVLDALDRLRGPHHPLTPPDLGPVSEWAEGVLRRQNLLDTGTAFRFPEVDARQWLWGG